MLKTIHAREGSPLRRGQGREVMVKLSAMRLTKAAELVEAKAHETLTYFAFPSNHWRQPDLTPQLTIKCSHRCNNPAQQSLYKLYQRPVDRRTIERGLSRV